MTIEELIESLPGDLQPWAKIWAPVLLRWSQDQLAEFIASAAGMPWDAAYQKLIDTMTIEEKIAELKLLRAELEQLNHDNAAFMVAQRSLFFSLLAKMILSLQA